MSIEKTGCKYICVANIDLRKILLKYHMMRLGSVLLMHVHIVSYEYDFHYLTIEYRLS